MLICLLGIRIQLFQDNSVIARNLTQVSDQLSKHDHGFLRAGIRLLSAPWQLPAQVTDVAPLPIPESNPATYQPRQGLSSSSDYHIVSAIHRPVQVFSGLVHAFFHMACHLAQTGTHIRMAVDRPREQIQKAFCLQVSSFGIKGAGSDPSPSTSESRDKSNWRALSIESFSNPK